MTARDDVSPLLTWTEDGEPRSGRFGDVYFSRDDGLAESRAVFLGGCGLPEAWSRRERFVVAELGFGTGLNIAALLHLWRRARPAGARLHVFTIEGFPLTVDEARAALSNWPEIAEESEALLAAWPAPTPGFHRMDLPALGATVDVAVGDAAWALEQWSGQADAWFLDGFSPALNPGMWSPEVLALVAGRSAPGARLATFTVAGGVRRGLAAEGFAVEKRPGHGRKRERLEARLASPPPATAARPSIAVVGAGAAGLAVARALLALGTAPVLVEAEAAGAGASGFPAGLVTPRLDAGDAVVAGLHAQALERAGQLYRRIPGAILADGVLQLEQAERDAGRFAKVAGQPLWPEDGMRIADAAEATARLGEPVEGGGLLMRDALAIAPAAVLADWSEGVRMVAGGVERLARDEQGWALLDAAGGCLARADAVVLAAGWGNAALLGALGQRLTPVRGQADWAEGPASPAAAWGGYVAPTGTGVLFGATHDRGDASTEVREADSRRNRETLARRLPRLAERLAEADRGARAAVRATTPDRLPIAGAVPGQQGLYVLGGLGSRGWCVAPLLGEHLAAMALGAPSPLPAAFAERLRPNRLA